MILLALKRYFHSPEKCWVCLQKHWNIVFFFSSPTSWNVSVSWVHFYVEKFTKGLKIHCIITWYMFLSILYIQLRDTWGHMWCVQWGYSFSCHGTIRNTTGGPSAWDGTLHQPWAYSPFILENNLSEFYIYVYIFKCSFAFVSIFWWCMISMPFFCWFRATMVRKSTKWTCEVTRLPSRWCW